MKLGIELRWVAVRKGGVEHNKADCHKSRAPSLQQQTDRPTDKQTERLTEWLIESLALD